MSENQWKSRLPLLEVLLMLVLIISAIAWYGLAAKPFLLETEIKQADIKSLFEKDTVPVPKPNIDSILIAAEAQEDETVDSTSKYILLCGDSMTEQMRFALEEYAKKNGHKLMTCTWYSSTTTLWSESDRLSVLIKEYKPDIIWFTLGSNELFLPAVAKREKHIQDIINEADTAKVPFIWIGPPNWKDDTGINELIKKNVGTSRFYNSSNFREKLARGKDGAHPTKAAAAVWTDSIAAWYKNESLYKKRLILSHPKDSIAARPYKPTKEVCAPARENRWSVRMLSPTDVPTLCAGEPAIAAVEVKKEPATSNTATTKPIQTPVKKDTAKTQLPIQPKDTQKVVLPPTPNDSAGQK